MPAPLTLIDRLRIARAVWTVDTYLQSLPSRSRRAIRRELRTNLRSSAAEVGAREAIRGLGSLRRLSLDYLEAEYGEGRPRAEFLKGLFWATAVDGMLLTGMVVGFESFIAGLEAGRPDPGTYTWSVGKVFGVTGDVTYDEVGYSGFSASASALFFAYSLIAFLIGSRIWRVVQVWWRRVRNDRVARQAVGGR